MVEGFVEKIYLALAKYKEIELNAGLALETIANQGSILILDLSVLFLVEGFVEKLCIARAKYKGLN